MHHHVVQLWSPAVEVLCSDPCAGHCWEGDSTGQSQAEVGHGCRQEVLGHTVQQRTRTPRVPKTYPAPSSSRQELCTPEAPKSVGVRVDKRPVRVARQVTGASPRSSSKASWFRSQVVGQTAEGGCVTARCVPKGERANTGLRHRGGRWTSPSPQASGGQRVLFAHCRTSEIVVTWDPG